jgi:hypothetical protein
MSQVRNAIDVAIAIGKRKGTMKQMDERKRSTTFC